MSSINIGSITGSGTVVGDNNTVNNTIEIKPNIKRPYFTLEQEWKDTISRHNIPLVEALNNDDIDRFFEIVQQIFATLPYDAKVTEGYFHSHVHVILKTLGFKVYSEVETNLGRIDSVLETASRIYIFEFKKDDAAIAIRQILKKKYYQQYQASDKEIVLVGIALDYAEKNITNWKIARK